MTDTIIPLHAEHSSDCQVCGGSSVQVAPVRPRHGGALPAWSQARIGRCPLWSMSDSLRSLLGQGRGGAV